LIELLPSGSPDMPLIEKADGPTGMAVFPIAKMLICTVLVGIPFISAASSKLQPVVGPRFGQVRHD
jgi:hypothetical protein